MMDALPIGAGRSRNVVAAAGGADDYCAILRTPFARVGIRTAGDAVIAVRYLPLEGECHEPRNDLARRACREILAYVHDPKFSFSVRCAPEGSRFQRSVWDAIADIPSGHTRTYGDLARDLRNAPRAVGNACGSNPIPLIVPCHRVVAAGGRLGGFMHSVSDFPLSIKRWLLAHEAR